MWLLRCVLLYVINAYFENFHQIFYNPYTLVCTSPASSSPGKVKVSLSRSIDADSPAFGKSSAEFEYINDYAEMSVNART